MADRGKGALGGFLSGTIALAENDIKQRQAQAGDREKFIRAIVEKAITSQFDLQSSIAGEQLKQTGTYSDPFTGNQVQVPGLLGDPELQAKQRLFEMAKQAGQVPQPLGGYSLQEQQLGAPGLVQEAAQQREMGLLQQGGLLGSQARSLLSPIMFDPNSGQYIDQSGNLVNQVPRGTPIRNLPLTGETLGERKTEVDAATKATELNARLRELEQSEKSIAALFERAKTEVPPISGELAGPGILPVSKLGRRAALATGFNEKAAGFSSTYPIQARKQLRTLEKGGRFTDQDVEQILQASTPSFTESETARASKLQELLNTFREEREIVEKQLLDLQSGAASFAGNRRSNGNGVGLGDIADPIVRTGTDQATGKRVGQTQSGKIVPLE